MLILQHSFVEEGRQLHGLGMASFLPASPVTEGPGILELTGHLFSLTLSTAHVTLDPNTAFFELCLKITPKWARRNLAESSWEKPERFSFDPCVLGRGCFSSGDITGRWKWATGLTGSWGFARKTWIGLGGLQSHLRMDSGLWNSTLISTRPSPPLGLLSHWVSPPAGWGSSWTMKLGMSPSIVWLMGPTSTLSPRPPSLGLFGLSSASGSAIQPLWPSATEPFCSILSPQLNIQGWTHHWDWEVTFMGTMPPRLSWASSKGWAPLTFSADKD